MYASVTCVHLDLSSCAETDRGPPPTLNIDSGVCDSCDSCDWVGGNIYINRALNLNETVDPKPILLETDQARLECSKLLSFEVWTFGWTSFRKFPSIPRKSSNHAFNVAKCIFFFHFLTGSDKTPGGQTLSGGATYAVASSRGPVANEETKTVNVPPFHIVSPFVALRKGNGEGKTSMGRTVASSPTHLISKLWGRPWRCLDCCDSFRLVCRANWPLQMAPNMKGNLRLIENMALESRGLSRSVVASYILRISYAPTADIIPLLL